MKVGFVSLGCSKNLIDTEIAIGHFKNNNYEIDEISVKMHERTEGVSSITSWNSNKHMWIYCFSKRRSNKYYFGNGRI